MGGKNRRRAVVPRNGDHLRAKLEQIGQHPVNLFDDINLGIKIPVFTPAVGVLDVNEKVIEGVPLGFHDFHQVRKVPGRFSHIHTHKPGKAPVHWVGSDSQGMDPVKVVHPGYVGNA